MSKITDIEDLLGEKIVLPDISKKYDESSLLKIDKIIERFKNEDIDLLKLKKEYKLNIKNIDFLHRYHQLVSLGVMKENKELEYKLTIKKGRGHSGVEVIAVSTYPLGKYAGCPANCHFCPKEPELEFEIEIKEVLYDDEKYISFEFDSIDTKYNQMSRVIRYLIIKGKRVEILKVVSYGKRKIGTILKENLKDYEIKEDDIILALKTAQPRSYLSGEPAVARANQNGWDCVKQFRDIAIKRIMCGHSVTKVEGIVIGGTWSFYPEDYQEEFIRDFYYAANSLYDKDNRERLSLEEEIKINRKSKCRVIGLTLETRPDFINEREIKRLRSYGCTRVQLGIQHNNDKILKKINRGCNHKKNVRAIKLLKDACFKVDIHLMPDLPGSDFWEDIKMFEDVLNGEDLQADQWKIYPCQTLEYTKIKEWYESGEYKPYYEERKIVNFDNVYIDKYYKENSELIKFLSILNIDITLWIFVLSYFDIRYLFLLLLFPIPMLILDLLIIMYKQERESNPLHHLLTYIVPRVHPWIRLNRIIRDNPENMIVGGLNKSHYRNEIEEYLDKTKQYSQDIRYREIKGREYSEKDVRLLVREYKASGGLEFFISFEDIKNNYLLGFLRLRIPKNEEHYIKELSNTALIRELHVYGWMVPQGKSEKIVQHRGFGKKLLKKAEEIVLKYKFKRVAVISGEGVREYYQKQGYHTEGSYEIKNL